jgi:hypothetical protein
VAASVALRLRVDEVEGEVDANLKHAQALRQAVLQRAFAFDDVSETTALP